MHLAVVVGLFAVLFLLAAAAIVVFRRLWQKKSKARDAAINLAILLFTCCFTGLGLEIYFYQFAIEPEGFAITLATRRWQALHYNQNSRGFRDAEHTPADFRGKRALFVVGDSFAAGSGIPDQRDRFSDRLAMRLEPEWRVVNLSIGGWDTVDELEALRQYPVKPNIVLLSYYLNDIKHAVETHGYEFIQPLPKPPLMLRPLVNNSYFVNTVYWRVFRAKAQFVKQNYWGNLKRYYTDDSVWAEHAAVLNQFVMYCQSQNIELYAVIFPNLTAIEESQPITQKVQAHLEALGVSTLDLSPALAGRDPATLIVNSVNSHPNEATHHTVAALLEKFLRRQSPSLSE